jgi:putative phosphoesterase
MKIGIVSDTHNNIELTRKAVGIFRENGVDLIVHAGDLTSPRMLELFRDFPLKIVLGNGDIDVEEISDVCHKMGYGDIGNKSVFDAGGKRIIVFHGDNVSMFREAVVSGEYDYIIKGHTHYFENYVSNNARVINPGSLYGSDEFSIAVLDTDEDRVTRIRVEE